jgi:hypothetical protein
MTGDWQKVLERLQPLKAEIDAALAVGDIDAAMQLAFQRAADAVSLMSMAPVMPGEARVHSVYVELAPQRLAVLEDGTLEEKGMFVHLAHRCQDIVWAEADLLACNWKDAARDAPYWAVDSS